MSGSLESLLKYTHASAGGAANDHDPIARVRPVDVYAVEAEIERLRALLSAAKRIWNDRARAVWGWHPDSGQYGYYLDDQWAGTDIGALIAAEAAKEKPDD